MERLQPMTLSRIPYQSSPKPINKRSVVTYYGRECQVMAVRYGCQSKHATDASYWGKVYDLECNGSRYFDIHESFVEFPEKEPLNEVLEIAKETRRLELVVS